MNKVVKQNNDKRRKKMEPSQQTKQLQTKMLKSFSRFKSKKYLICNISLMELIESLDSKKSTKV